MIRYCDVVKSFTGHPVLRGVSLDVFPGTVHFIIGASGVGKSVAIRQLVGLLRPDSGTIEFDGRSIIDLDERGFFAIRKRCQMIFQHATLFEAMSVLENVAMPVHKRFRVPRAQAEKRALAMLGMVGAQQLAERSPATLGHGVRKRIAIARALALEPEVLLYDEPTTGLDPVAARRTDRLIRTMADELELTSLVVSHDLASVRAIGDWVTFLHEGRVAFDGSPDDLFKSSDPRVRGFVHGAGRRWQPLCGCAPTNHW